VPLAWRDRRYDTRLRGDIFWPSGTANPDAARGASGRMVFFNARYIPDADINRSSTLLVRSTEQAILKCTGRQ